MLTTEPGGELFEERLREGFREDVGYLRRIEGKWFEWDLRCPRCASVGAGTRSLAGVHEVDEFRDRGMELGLEVWREEGGELPVGDCVEGLG